MTRLQRITGKQLIALLKSYGFSVIRTKGSHNFLKSEDGRCTVVPIHSGGIIGPGLLRKILRDCELNNEHLS